MLPNVNLTVLDGQLGIASPRDQAQAKVGACSAGVEGTVYAFTDYAAVRASLGHGPLSDAVAYTLLCGCKKVYAVRAAATAGTLGAVTPNEDNEGGGVLTVSGSPVDAFDVRVQILKTGGRGVGWFRYSLDAGESHWSKSILIPSNGSYVVPNLGMTLIFTVPELAEDFTLADEFDFSSTPPTCADVDLSAAIVKLCNSPNQFENVHVVGEPQQATFAAVASKMATEATNNRRWMYCVMEMAGRAEGDTTTEWVEGLQGISLNAESVRGSGVASWGNIACPLDGCIKKRNLASIILGRIGALSVNTSPGRVDVGGLPLILDLLPNDTDPLLEAHVELLDTARFTTVRRYQDVPGFYVTNFRMFAAPGSDYTWGENRRVMDKACALLRARGIRSMHRDADEIDGLQAELQEELDRMTPVEIRSGLVSIPDDQDIVGTSTLLVRARLQPIGSVRWLDIEVGFQLPTTETEGGI